MRYTLLALLLAGCGLLPVGAPPPAPSVDEASAHLDRVIDAGLARDWPLLCSLASGTCEGELQGAEHLAPDEPPRVADIVVREPTREGQGWLSGGVLFVLCGADGLGDPYESEVLVFDDGERLLATAAVYWKGTRVSFAPPGDDFVVEEPAGGPSRCE